MSKRRSKTLVFGGLIIVTLIIVYVGSVLLENDHGPTAPAAGHIARSETGVAPEQGGTAQMNELVEIRQQDGNRKKIRRIKTRQQRQQLINAIKMARDLRLKRERDQRLYEEPTDGDENSKGSLPKETIRDAVGAVIEDVKHCYQDQLETTPDLAGKLVVNFTIKAENGAGGVVDQVEINDESDETMRTSLKLSECIVDTIYTLELPEPEEGGVVKVSYPFFMAPHGPEDEQQ
jgi:hypothetical protein